MELFGKNKENQLVGYSPIKHPKDLLECINRRVKCALDTSNVSTMNGEPRWYEGFIYNIGSFFGDSISLSIQRDDGHTGSGRDNRWQVNVDKSNMKYCYVGDLKEWDL